MEKGIAVTTMLRLQSSGIQCAELETPQPNFFIADSNAPLSKQIFDEWSGTPAVAEIESVVQPDNRK